MDIEKIMESKDSELVVWSDRLSCGIKQIDNQHKGLVALVNDMFNHVTGDEVEEYVYFNKVILEAVKYIKIHFATEEKLMLAAKLPNYAMHKKAHNSFILTVVDNIYDYKAGKKFNLYSFTKFLKDWILSHVALVDKQCFAQIKIIPAQKPAETDAPSKIAVNV